MQIKEFTLFYFWFYDWKKNPKVTQREAIKCNKFISSLIQYHSENLTSHDLFNHLFHLLIDF